MVDITKLNEDDLEICDRAFRNYLSDYSNKFWINQNKHIRSRRAHLEKLSKLSNAMHSLELFLEELATRKNHEDMLITPEVCKDALLPGGYKLKIPPCQQDFLKSLPLYGDLSRSLSHDCRYSDEVEVFLPIFKNYSNFDDYPFKSFCWNPDLSFSMNKESHAKYTGLINEFIKELHQKLREPKTRKKILDRRRAVENNSQEFIKYVDKLFERIAEHLVLRIDLAYQKGPIFKNVSLEDFVKDLNRFHANMRHNQLFDHMTGYIVKIEYGVEKGVHAHLLLFFDASKRKSDTDLAQKIGEYWRIQITEYRGFYWNCNTSENKKNLEARGFLGIGEIHAEDKAKRDNLNYIIRYFCKSEQFIKPKTNQKMKLLRKGLPPKQKGRKRGAPRASQRKVRSSDHISTTPVTSS
ncbi:YagK/YfjJ domain-containing protein [Nitrosomonas communis]|uniref:Inovirus Gp2 family protein n=1 Tax=Nitrosomonas communis TaxID=44574 RepID=A0A1I4LM83_9PROT|nr:inovirus-type Gp2 protein [Nitrosomonas communis]SFL91956.1 Protein of unknown function [Nitrosomonas communis]